jgi:4-alpha-glucanotransferase
VAEERAEAAAEQAAVMALLRERGLLPAMGPGSGAAEELAPQEVQQIVEALYAFTALTPSSLIGVALVDAVGETRTQNQPGTHEEYPNWCIPLAGPDGAILIENLDTNQRFKSLVRLIGTVLKEVAR